MKEKLFRELKSKGFIPETISVDDVTEEYLLNLSSQSNNNSINLDDFKAEIFKDFDNKIKDLGIDKVDVKHLKLPGNAADDNDEYKNLNEKQIAQKKMLKFVKHLYSTGSKYSILPGNTLALNAEGTGSVGGYTVPVEFVAEVSRLLNLYGLFRRNAKNITFNSYTATMPKLDTAPSGGFVSELGAKSESNPTFAQITFTRRTYAYITGLSKQLLEDTGVDLIGLLAELAANDFASAEDSQGFLGTGSPITGAFASVTDSGYIVTTSGTNPNTVTYANIVSLMSMPKSRALASQSCKFYMHKTILSLIMSLLDDQNRPIFTPTEQTSILATKTLFGYPYELGDALNTSANVASKPIILFGDLSQAATFAQRSNFEIAMSDTATVGSNSAFEKNLVFYRFEQGFDIQVHQPTALAKIVTHA